MQVKNRGYYILNVNARGLGDVEAYLTKVSENGRRVNEWEETFVDQKVLRRSPTTADSRGQNIVIKTPTSRARLHHCVGRCLALTMLAHQLRVKGGGGVGSRHPRSTACGRRTWASSPSSASTSPAWPRRRSRCVVPPPPSRLAILLRSESAQSDLGAKLDFPTREMFSGQRACPLTPSWVYRRRTGRSLGCHPLPSTAPPLTHSRENDRLTPADQFTWGSEHLISEAKQTRFC